MERANLMFDGNDSFVGYIDENKYFVSIRKEPPYREIIAEDDYKVLDMGPDVGLMDLKFHNVKNNKWKLYFFTTFSE